jgi:hypothetical protein
MLTLATRSAYALLITGAPERVLAMIRPELKALLCEATEHEQPPMACGACPSCGLFESEEGHPDLHLLRPEGKLKVIKIDTVRDILPFLDQSPLRGGFRIVIFFEADTLNRAAQNALLKSLEEPGAKTLLILLTDKPHLLLATIKSRCQHVHSDDDIPAQNKELMQMLMAPTRLIELTQQLKDVPLADIVDLQMRMVYDLIYQGGQNQLNLHHLYDFLVETREKLQQQVALNPELMLCRLLMKWKKHIRH